jgi:guanyl-specific ribonuclease Sa
LKETYGPDILDFKDVKCECSYGNMMDQWIPGHKESRQGAFGNAYYLALFGIMWTASGPTWVSPANEAFLWSNGRWVSQATGRPATAAEARSANEALLAAQRSAGARGTARLIGKPDGTIVDVGPTLDRISRCQRFPHRNDGSVFQNREGLLPAQPPGYYTEYVHPTPGVNGPGGQRIVIGRGGEIYYTPDHYGTFIPVN